MVAVACSGNQLVRVWDCRQQQHATAVMGCSVPTDAQALSYIYCVSTVPAHGGHIPSQLLFGSNSGRLLMWDLRQPNVLWSLGKLSGRVLGCASSPCGRRIVAGSANGQVRVSIVTAICTLSCSINKSGKLSLFLDIRYDRVHHPWRFPCDCCYLATGQ